MKFPRIPWPERREKEPEAPRAIPLSLVRSARFASWIAYFCLVYFLWLYTLDIARDRAAPLHLTHVGWWLGEMQFYFPYVIGFAAVAIGIPYVAKIALPTFMSLNWRGNAWPKGWALFIAIAVSLVVFAGTFSIQGDAIIEKGRDAAVAVAKVEQGKAVLQAQINAKEAELKSMMENKNAYLAQAASVGAAEWQRSYIDRTAVSDPQHDRIIRALGAARASDAERAALQDLRQQAVLQVTTAAVAERVTPRAGQAWIGQTLDWIQGVRAILLSLVMDIVALLMPWIAMRLEQSRSLYVAEDQKGWADESHMIADARAEPKVATAPMDAGYHGPRMWNEKGEEMAWVEGYVRKKDNKWIPGHYRVTGRRRTDIDLDVQAPAGTGDARFATERAVFDFTAGGPQATSMEAGDGTAETGYTEQNAEVVAEERRLGSISADDAEPSRETDSRSDQAGTERPLPPAEFDRLVARGEIDEDGNPLSQESVESVELAEDEPRWPLLSPPVEEREDA